MLSNDRIAVAIGTGGKTKEKLEYETGTFITIDSKTGEYQVTPQPKPVNPDLPPFLESPGVRIYTTRHILEAINIGFNPEKALKLIDPELMMEVIDLEKILGGSPNKLQRMKGRLIGDAGKIRQAIEKFALVDLSVYDKYLAIIGGFSSMKIAKKAINMILQGSAHKTVLAYLHTEHQKRKQEEFTEMWKPTL